MIYEAYKGHASVAFTTDDEAQEYIKGLAGWQVRKTEVEAEPPPIVKNWVGLTKALYAFVPLLQKSMNANPQGLNLFTTLLTEGKIIPDVSEVALKNAFLMMGIVFSEEEKLVINGFFQSNGFGKVF